jgi:hypothetical protein
MGHKKHCSWRKKNAPNFSLLLRAGYDWPGAFKLRLLNIYIKCGTCRTTILAHTLGCYISAIILMRKWQFVSKRADHTRLIHATITTLTWWWASFQTPQANDSSN